MKRFFISILLLIQVMVVTAQTGTIKGTVIDAKTKEALIGTTVLIKGTTQGTITDFDGNYVIPNVEVGSHTIAVSFISYDTQEFQVEVKPDNNVELNVALLPATLEIEGVQVVAKANRESETMLLVEQKNAVLAKQTIGAQEISRKGASDAESAVAKISGISKQEGVKNVFVRGLGDRFNSTTLNGFPVSSEDPEYKNISLDIFSSDIIKTVDVNKVFSSGMSGDVTGAEINIGSKELVSESELIIDLSVNANTETVNHEGFLITDGAGSLGFIKSGTEPSGEEFYDYGNSLDPGSQDFQLGKEFGIAGGKRYEIGHARNPLSFYVIGNYETDFNYINGITRGSNTSGIIYQDQVSDEYEKTTSHMAMANLSYSFNKYDLSYNFLAVHSAKQLLTDDYGRHDAFQSSADYDYVGLIRRQQNNDNTLLVNQLRLTKEFNKRLSGNVGVAYNFTRGSEPDRRVNHLGFYGDDILKPIMGTGRQQRYFTELNVNDINMQLSFSYKLSDESDNASQIIAGYKGRLVYDDFESVEWDNSRLDGSSNLPELDRFGFVLDPYFNQEYLDNGRIANDPFRSEYTVNKGIHSGYGDLLYQMGANLVLDAGIKVDLVNIDVDYDVNRGARVGTTKLDELFILPSFNIKYDLSDKNSLRLGASRTYTLPQSKEISPYQYIGRQWKSQGNPDLQPSTNYNLELKWDFYLSRDELLSIAGFSKLIQDPISRVEIASAGGFLSYENIADEATVSGVELELKKNLYSILTDDGNSKKLSIGVNFSYLKTDVEVNDGLNFTNKKTELQGASPILVNADLSYEYTNEKIDFTSSVVANYYSDRIYTVGAGGFQDINEDGLIIMDFVSSVKFNNRWKVSLKAKNLLNPTHKLTREPQGEGVDPIVLSSYKKGLDFSLGLSYKF
ncbi:TonB-dependent receptor domain-containing protein [uncultured Draconibacterium sp.]|uniref:TonB-dependent receptor n=1 Tax=uncultured Draconibacterium sp. TaxID=1573823 RepID=UPI0029C652FC|nr:TonB-dependent receptor [uncultured Draconibacterium sp.]